MAPRDCFDLNLIYAIEWWRYYEERVLDPLGFMDITDIEICLFTDQELIDIFNIDLDD
jgi:hypothetical protein